MNEIGEHVIRCDVWRELPYLIVYISGLPFMAVVDFDVGLVGGFADDHPDAVSSYTKRGASQYTQPQG